jgi:hypothetical protein
LDIEQSQQGQEMEYNVYSLYVYAIRSPVTRDIYLRRLRIFFHVQLLAMNETMETCCNLFAEKSRMTSKWTFIKILEFLQFQKERVIEGKYPCNPSQFRQGNQIVLRNGRHRNSMEKDNTQVAKNQKICRR